MHRILTIAGVLTCLLCLTDPQTCRGQKNKAPDYDYKALAVTSILNAAEEASKLPDIEQRVTLLINAAKVLPLAKRDDAIRVLNLALDNLKEWVADEQKGRRRRYTADKLRGEVLAVYAKLDSAKAIALQKEVRPEDGKKNSASTGDFTKSLRPEGNWIDELSARRAPSDEAAKIALSIIDSDPDRASALILKSVQGGEVSSTIREILEKLDQSGKRELVNKLEANLGQTLAETITLDPFSLAFATTLASDPEMSPAARSGFIRFFMNSLETWAALVKGEDGQGGLDSSYVGTSFLVISSSVRPAIAQYSPDDLIRLNVLFDQVLPFVPEHVKSLVQGNEPEKSSDPKDILADILKEPNSMKRDLRLVRLVARFLNKAEGDDSDLDLDFVAEAISHFSEPTLKTAFSDCLVIRRVNSLVKLKKFIDAQRLAGSISAEETRAWALLALAAAVKDDRVLAFELTSNALKALDAAAPSPARVELALRAVAMFAKGDPQRAFETLATAARYANSSPAKIEAPSSNLGRAVNLEVSIGNMRLKLAHGAESLAEVSLDPAISGLAKSDWFRAQYLANEFREPTLRLALKLNFAEAVLSGSPVEVKPRDMKATAPTTPYQ